MKTRLLSAAVVIAMGIAALFLIKTPIFAILVFLLTFAITREFLGAVEVKSRTLRVCGYVIAFITNLRFIQGVVINEKTYLISIQILDIFLIFMILIVFLDFIIKHKKIEFKDVFATLFISTAIGYSVGNFIVLQQIISETPEMKHSPVMNVVLAICGAALADSGAYFVGRAIGKHKLCPEVSPNKTVEGFVGGIITNAVLFPVIYYGFCFVCSMDFDMKTAILYAILGTICAPIGALGDLTMSMIKRQLGIKDFGNLIPGHGGLLDRFDSLLFVVPVYVMFYLYFIM